ncbi:MAG TPA: LysR family transcriptional regulator [Paraburkholderia sp.]|jgi:DNA-binding transcriptional LysR family regulator
MADLRDVNLNRLAIFVEVVEAGSLTAAAERLRLAKTMVSTHMQRLEAEVGASLLVRTTRRLNVTEAGRRFYESAREILRAAEAALADIAGDASTLRGTLRVSAPVDYGALVVAPALVDLHRAHPQLHAELVCSDRYADLIGENLDAAVRLGRLADSSYRSVKIGRFVKWIVAAPSFVAEHGMPRKPEDLAALPFVALSALPRPLSFELVNARGMKRSIRCQSAVVANTATACRAATLAGGGFGLLTDFSTACDIEAGTLVRLLPSWMTPEGDIRVVFPPTSRVPAKTMALADALRQRV